MPYTEVRKAGGRTKYYRVVSYRKDGKISHQRQYLGTDLSTTDLKTREKRADTNLGHPLDALLDKKQRPLLEQIRTEHLSKHPNTFENRYESFCSEFAFDSTGIEGNTLTLQETAAVLFEGATPARSLREVYEVLNHKK